MPGRLAGPAVRERFITIHLVLAISAAPGFISAAESPASNRAPLDPSALALLNRVTWGVNGAEVAAISAMGPDGWLEAQLHPPAQDRLPPAVQAQIDAMSDLHVPIAKLLLDSQRRGAAANHIMDHAMKDAAFRASYKASAEPLREAEARSILRDLYSPDQLKEQMTWFWFNHFNVNSFKADIRMMIGDYEETALRAHALGRFRDLLEATLRHPVMLQYLDNAQNTAGHINENYAREIMELHTMGVDSGYTQADVQALARILTGVGLTALPKPGAPPQRGGGIQVGDGVFEFDNSRHDHGDKVFLGHHIRGRGFAEVQEALDILSRQPATAQHISRQLALFFVSDNPPNVLVQRMSETFMSTDGDIAEVLTTMFRSPEFKASLGTKFKDPAHYVISSVRLAYNDRVVQDTTPIIDWLYRLNEGLYSRDTPDGFPMNSAYWNGPGQMQARFGVARQIGSSSAGLFPPDAPGAAETPAYPDIRAAVHADGLADTLTPATRAALAEASSPKEWNSLFLASPDFMRR